MASAKDPVKQLTPRHSTRCRKAPEHFISIITQSSRTSPKKGAIRKPYQVKTTKYIPNAISETQNRTSRHVAKSRSNNYIILHLPSYKLRTALGFPPLLSVDPGKRPVDSSVGGDDEPSLTLSELNTPSTVLLSLEEPTQKKQRSLSVKNAARAQELSPSTNSIAGKSPCIGEPPVWAENRIELCETLPYYNSFRGAACTLNGHVRGLMLDQDDGNREYIDTHVAIVRAGGGMGETANGVRGHIKDHSRKDPTAKAFLNNMEHGIPVNVIIGNVSLNNKRSENAQRYIGSKNSACPSVIPHRYCVLGSFQITEVWAERITGKVVLFYRLEKLDLRTTSWWAPIDADDDGSTCNFGAKAIRQTCRTCSTSSPQIYELGWMCVNENCTSFWMHNGDPAPEMLSYNRNFLNERSEWTGFEPPFNLRPALMDPSMSQEKGFSVSKASTKGIVCPLCNRCIVRRYWDAWRCETEGCDYTMEIPKDPISAVTVKSNVNDMFDGPAISDDWWDPMIRVQITQHGLYRIHKYHLPPENTVTHFHACNTINQAAGGSDELFWNLQIENMCLQRFRMTQAIIPGQLVAHFASNSGLPYKYVAEADSKAFSEVPKEVLDVLKRGKWAAEQTLPDQEIKPFNEVLTVGYLEGSRMGYHDDGESTVGPTVVSLSLGGDSEFNFRMKAKYYTGFSKGEKRSYNPNLPITSGCYLPEQRHRLNKLAQTMDKAQLTVKAQKVLAGAKKNPPELLKLKVRHGDIIVQHGTELQVRYEHQANPTDKLRFALTARHIKPETISPDQLWKGKLPDGFNNPANAYDGNLALYEEYRRRRGIVSLPVERPDKKVIVISPSTATEE